MGCRSHACFLYSAIKADHSDGACHIASDRTRAFVSARGVREGSPVPQEFRYRALFASARGVHADAAVRCSDKRWFSDGAFKNTTTEDGIQSGQQNLGRWGNLCGAPTARRAPMKRNMRKTR